MIIHLLAKHGSGQGEIPESKPVLTVQSQAPSEVVVTLINYGGGDFIIEASTSAAFAAVTQTATGNEANSFQATLSDLGTGTFYLRGRKSTGTVNSDTTEIIVETTPLRVLDITSIISGDGSVTINHDCTASETGSTTVAVMRRIAPSEFAQIDTFTTATTPYTDNTVVNGDVYDYRLDLLPSTIDFTRSTSNIVQASPVAGTPTLTAPTTPSVVWDEVTGGSGTFIFTDASGGDAEEFVVNIKVQSTGVSVASTTLTAPTVSYAFSGLTVGVQYTFEVYATAVGFNNSTTSSIQREAIDPNATALTLEQFGGEAYTKPLDGRLYDSQQFPLINFEPLDQTAFEALVPSWTYDVDFDTDFPKGVTKITPVNDSGTPVTGVFTSQDVGKKFVGLKANRNGDSAGFIDEYVPFSISARYANVIYQDGDICLVDFEYNGNAAAGEPSQALNGGKGRIFFDNKDAWSAFKTQVETDLASGDVDVEFAQLQRTGYAVSSYEMTQYQSISLTGSNDVNITTSTGDPSTGARFRVKFGVEDYYAFQPEEGAKFYTNQPLQLFTPSSYNGKVVSHGGEWITPHHAFKAGDSFDRTIWNGTLGSGTMLFIHCNSQAEIDEMEAGYGVDSTIDHCVLKAFECGSAGTYTGDGSVTTHDVDKFGFAAFVDFKFRGKYAAGFWASGNVGAGFFTLFKEGTLNFTPESDYSVAVAEFDAKFTTDLTGIGNGGGETDYLPDHAIEITSDNGNFFEVLSMGGDNDSTVYVIKNAAQTKAFLFLGSTPRYNQINGYINSCFIKSTTTTPFVTDGAGSYTRTTKKTLVDWEIVKEKEDDGTTPKFIRCSKDYMMSEDRSLVSPNLTIPTVGAPIRNAIRTHLNPTTILNTKADLFSNAQRDWIHEVDTYAKGWQIDDQFKLCAWIEVDDFTGLSVGDTVTGDTSGATGVIRYIDDGVKYTRRLVLGNANDSTNVGNFSTDTTLNGGAYTITDSVWEHEASFDPSQVYTVDRKQRINYSGSKFNVWVQLDDSSAFAVAQTVTTPSFSGTVVSKDNWETTPTNAIKIRITSGLPLVGETLTITSGGSGSATILTNDNFDDGTTCYKFSYLQDWAVGIAKDERTFEGGYFSECAVLDRDLPDKYSGALKDPLLYIEVVNSEAEELLDGNSRRVKVSFRDNAKWDNESGFRFALINQNRRYISSATTYGTGYASITYDTEWYSVGDPAGHLNYGVFENTEMYYDVDFKAGNWRSNQTNKTRTALLGLSKGKYIKDCVNMPDQQWLQPQKTSSNDTFSKQETIYNDNPSYDPSVSGWAFDEQMITDNGGNDISLPKLGFYGSNSADSSGAITLTGNNVIRSATSSDAPELPKTIKDILTLLGEPTTIT
jgi:hypothetical protein